jgi:hypothetical protein
MPDHGLGPGAARRPVRVFLHQAGLCALRLDDSVIRRSRDIRGGHRRPPEGAGTGQLSENELGVSTQWSQLSDDESTLFYFLVVKNDSNNTVEYFFVEADF